MPSLLLIRHGQASFGTEDYDVLSELGARQAEVTGTALSESEPGGARVVSGTLRRQLDTAVALNAGPVAEDPRWNEFDAAEIVAAHGEEPVAFEGPESAGIDSRRFQDLLDPALEAWIAAAEDSPCSRTWPDFVAETSAATLDLGDSLGRGETAFAVTSAGVIAAIAASLLGDARSLFVALNRIQINCGVTKIVFGARGPSVISLNEHSHLQRLDRALVTYR